MIHGFTSAFAKDLDDMINLNVALNRAEQTYLERAKAFDKFCAAAYPDADVLSESIVISWLKPGLEKSSNGFHYRAAFARAFATYQKSIGKQAYIFPKSYAAGRNTFIPYILSDEELSRLFQEIDSYQKQSNPFEPLVMSVYYRLTYTCGLRPREGRELRRSEIDLNSGELRIVNSKWHKSRTLVMSEDMCRLARKYAAIRDLAFPESNIFFPNRIGEAYSAAQLTKMLNAFFAKSQPDIPAELLPSLRVYDLRHRFATEALHRWLNQGVDLNARLPYLQTYMGHKELNSTAYYIHLLPERLVKSAGIDWDSMNQLLPRVELWEE